MTDADESSMNYLFQACEESSSSSSSSSDKKKKKKKAILSLDVLPAHCFDLLCILARFFHCPYTMYMCSFLQYLSIFRGTSPS